MSKPTQTHLNIIEKEYKKENLHRDVRIAILEAAMKLLNVSSPFSSSVN